LKEVQITEAISEPVATVQDRARTKAQYAMEITGVATLAEDSGLVVRALNGAPGVFSARYAGEPSDDKANNALLLANMEGIFNREAYYQATICLMLQVHEFYLFEGQCAGSIAHKTSGAEGFGYDPLFIPEGDSRTFGHYPPSEKNTISHRGKAVHLLCNFLNERLR